MCFTFFSVAEPVEESFDNNQMSEPYVVDSFYPYNYGVSTTPEATPHPFIDPTTPTNVTVIKGKYAMLACVVRHVGNAAVIYLALLVDR